MVFAEGVLQAILRWPVTASNTTNDTIAKASLMALLIITPKRIPMIRVVMERTDVMVVRSNPGRHAGTLNSWILGIRARLRKIRQDTRERGPGLQRICKTSLLIYLDSFCYLSFSANYFFLLSLFFCYLKCDPPRGILKQKTPSHFT